MTDRIAVVGAGQMGNGIAHVFAQSGFKVVMIDVGIAIELIRTLRQSRMKSQTMSDASKLPITRCSSSECTEFLM